MESDKKLETFPGSHQDRLEGKYAGKGYKQLLVDNYMAIYKIDETEKTVYIITVQYQGRNSLSEKVNSARKLKFHTED